MLIKVERRWCGWLAQVNGAYGFSVQSGCEAIGNALVYHTPGVAVAMAPVPVSSIPMLLREIYWHWAKGTASKV